MPCLLLFVAARSGSLPSDSADDGGKSASADEEELDADPMQVMQGAEPVLDALDDLGEADSKLLLDMLLQEFKPATLVAELTSMLSTDMQPDLDAMMVEHQILVSGTVGSTFVKVDGGLEGGSGTSGVTQDLQSLNFSESDVKILNGILSDDFGVAKDQDARLDSAIIDLCGDTQVTFDDCFGAESEITFPDAASLQQPNIMDGAALHMELTKDYLFLVKSGICSMAEAVMMSSTSIVAEDSETPITRSGYICHCWCIWWCSWFIVMLWWIVFWGITKCTCAVMLSE